MNLNNESEKNSGEATEQQSEVCSRYEGSYTKIFFMLLCAVLGVVFIMSLSEEAALKRIGNKYWLFEIVRVLSYIVFPFVAYGFIEIGLYFVKGIKANVVFYENYFEFNINRFGMRNCTIQYTDIAMLESLAMSGLSTLSIYLKEPVTNMCSSEFKPNSFLAPINRAVCKRFMSKEKVTITSTIFAKKTYESICAELINRLASFQEVEILDNPSAEG